VIALQHRFALHAGLSLLLVLPLVSAGCASGAAPAAEGEQPVGRAQSLFNGRDLTGWNGDPRYWRVENGAIVGETTAENPLTQNTFIVWDGGPVENFTLRVDFRLTGGNSGVQYRSRILEGWSAGGYQGDMDAANRYTGMLYEERGRGIVATRGQQVVIEPDGRFNVVGAVGDPAALGQAIDMSDWNTYEITAIDNHLVHRVNGRVTVDVVDNQVEERSSSGILALQIHTGAPMKAEFRNINLTRLP
jgi:hypothetical protein